MSRQSPESKKSNRGWKITAIVFILLTIGASALAYYYYGQNQNNISSYVSKTADRDYYYSQWQSDESKVATLNQQISSDNSQIGSDRSQIAQLQSELYNPTCKPNCESTIAQMSSKIDSLNHEVDNLNAQIASDKILIDSLNNQIANLRDILGIRRSQVIASGVNKNLPQCGEIGQPACQGSTACTNPANCTPQYILPSDFLSFCSPNCYQGVLVMSWSATQSMTLSFTSIYQTSSAISMSSSSTTSGNFAFPIIANFTANGGLSTNGFHNDSCIKDGNGNYHCGAVTLTYSETFDY